MSPATSAVHTGGSSLPTSRDFPNDRVGLQLLFPALGTSRPADASAGCGSTNLRTDYAMLGGGSLGFLAIGMALCPEVLRRDRKRKKLALVFACAGLAAELLYVRFDGLRHVLTNAFSIWMLTGPIVFGIHLLYRIYSVARPSVIPEP